MLIHFPQHYCRHGEHGVKQNWFWNGIAENILNSNLFFWKMWFLTGTKAACHQWSSPLTWVQSNWAKNTQACSQRTTPTLEVGVTRVATEGAILEVGETEVQIGHLTEGLLKMMWKLRLLSLIGKVSSFFLKFWVTRPALLNAIYSKLFFV